MFDRIVLHGEFSLFTVRGNFWYQIYRNRRKKVLCSRLSLITLTIWESCRKPNQGFYHKITQAINKLLDNFLILNLLVVFCKHKCEQLNVNWVSPLKIEHFNFGDMILE